MRIAPRRPSAHTVVTVMIVTVVACAGASPRGPAPIGARSSTHDAGATSVDVPRVDVPSVDVLAQHGASEMPMMRELARASDVTTPVELVATSSDACFRAVVAASEPVVAWFEDEAHEHDGAAFTGIAGLVPPSGPVCIRKGKRLRLVTSKPQAAIARAVVWQSP